MVTVLLLFPALLALLNNTFHNRTQYLIILNAFSLSPAPIQPLLSPLNVINQLAVLSGSEHFHNFNRKEGNMNV